MTVLGILQVLKKLILLLPAFSSSSLTSRASPSAWHREGVHKMLAE